MAVLPLIETIYFKIEPIYFSRYMIVRYSLTLYANIGAFPFTLFYSYALGPP